METSGHKVDQPGLRGHSHDPENDLMKQFVVVEKLEVGNLWVASFDTMALGLRYINTRDDQTPDFRIIDQFKGNRTVWED